MVEGTVVSQKKKDVRERNIMERKEVKKTCRWVAFGLLLYTLITNIVVVVDMIIRIVMIAILTSDAAEREQRLDTMFAEYMSDGTSMIIAVILGALFLWLWFIKKVTVKDISRFGKRMTVKTFLQLLCVFIGAQFVFDYVYQLMEWLLNLIGYSAKTSMEMATSTSTTVSMFLYAGIIGPIMEEVIYRGFVLRHLEKHGKIFAILVSAVLFGIMHANLPQSAFAFGVGLILAYVAMEYSIVWSIVIHIINNLVLSDLLSKVLQNCSEQIQNLVYMGLTGGAFLAGLVILWYHRKSIKQYLVENKTGKKKYLYAFTTVGIILFIVMELLTAILMLEAV